MVLNFPSVSWDAKIYQRYRDDVKMSNSGHISEDRDPCVSRGTFLSKASKLLGYEGKERSILELVESSNLCRCAIRNCTIPHFETYEDSYKLFFKT
jgi:hypothetical protein